MNRPYFYHGSLRRYTILMGTLLSDIQIMRNDLNYDPENSTHQDLITVPVKYGKGQYYVKVETPNSDQSSKKRVVLPHISYSMMDINYDPERKTNANCKILNTVVGARTENEVQWSFNKVPYNTLFTVSVRTKTMDDLLQIIEQLVILFDPAKVVKLNMANDQNEAYDHLSVDILSESVKISLTDISFSDTREDESQGQIEADLDFTLQGHLYKPVVEQPVITEINLNFTPNDLGNIESIDFSKATDMDQDTFIIH